MCVYVLAAHKLFQYVIIVNNSYCCNFKVFNKKTQVSAVNPTLIFTCTMYIAMHVEHGHTLRLEKLFNIKYRLPYGIYTYFGHNLHVNA